MNVTQMIRQMAISAKASTKCVANSPIDRRDAVLKSIREAISQEQRSVLRENQIDLSNAREKGLDAALIDRLELTPTRLEALLEGLSQVIKLPDPIGHVEELRTMPTGIQVGRMPVPLGVIGIIYESRPNVTIEAASLCIKAGNAVILRGGSEAINSNTRLGQLIESGLRKIGLPKGVVQVVPTVDREAVRSLLTTPEYVDLIIPRGGKSLIERVISESQVPVLKHLDGICHVYLDADADPFKGHRIIVNAKTQRYGTCNTMETLLVAEDVSRQLPRITSALQDLGVEVRGCAKAMEAAREIKIPATEGDWRTEYLGPILAVRIVKGLDEAIAHISKYGSGHTDCIVTENSASASKFLREVDSSSVMHNVSTRFADGYEYGLGAEIGISTDKLHARGPVGLEGLTSRKYVVIGDGHIRK